MLSIRHSYARGHSWMPWLDSRHSFSFADYVDSEHMGFGVLRVLNEDKVAAAGGFAKHVHRDMEIVSYVVSGVLQHEDSMGTGSLIKRGDVQRLSAGRGIWHSEYNASQHESVHFFFVQDKTASRRSRTGIART